MRSMEESLAFLAWYEELGVRQVVCTPHVMEELPYNRPPQLRAAFDQLQAHYTGSIELHLGAEYMLDSAFETHLLGGDMLPIWRNYLLVEVSYAYAPEYLPERLQQIMAQGYEVVLAHPERYLFLSREEYAELKAMGVLFQLNLPSLMGRYGERVRKRCEELLSAGYYELLGSDIHTLRRHKERFEEAKLSVRVLRQLEQIAALGMP